MDREKKARMLLAGGITLLIITVWSQKNVYSKLLKGQSDTAVTTTTVGAAGTSHHELSAPEAGKPSKAAGDLESSFNKTEPGIPPDPFRPKMALASSGSTPVHVTNNKGLISPLPIQPLSVNQASPVVQPETSEPEKNGTKETRNPASLSETRKPSDKPILKGIIHGKPDLAVFNYNGQIYYTKVGDTIGSNYRLRAIGRDTVLLTRMIQYIPMGKKPGERSISLSIEGGMR